MRSFVLSLLIIALVGVGQVALADGKVTVDPNAPGAREPEETTVVTDARLDQKVTYEAKQKAVLAILAGLSEKTGVTFKAGQNNKDWESQDIKMNVFAADVPLRELMGSMARVMKFKWSREGKENAYIYRFYMSPKTKMEADARRASEEEQRQKRLAEKRTKALAAYFTAANLSSQDLAELKTENPFLYAIRSTGILDSMGGFFTESPAAVEAITNGRAANISATAISPAGQQGLLKSMQDMWQFENKLMDRDRPFPEEIANNIGQANIRINRHLEELQGGPRMDFLLGEMQMGYGDHNIDLPIFDPDSSIAKLIGKALIKSQDDGIPLKDTMRGAELDVMKVVQEEMKKSDPGDPEPEHPDEPALHTKLKFKPEERSLPGVEAELAKASALSVVSDSYGPGWGMVRFAAEETELKAILDTVAEGYQYNWEKHGSVLEFRDRKWYEKRAALIPEAWLESWREKLKKTGTLDIADLAQIASLTSEQLRMNVMQDEVLSRANLMGVWYSARDALRLYAALSESQQAAIFTAGGIDMRALTPEQWALAEKLINSKNAAYLTNRDAAFMLSATRKKQDKQFRYSITLTTEGMDPLQWSFTTPLYEEPKPKPPAEQPTAKADAKPESPKQDQPPPADKK